MIIQPLQTLSRQLAQHASLFVTKKTIAATIDEIVAAIAIVYRYYYL